MLCHNNHAERPFAVLKAFAKMYPSLSGCGKIRVSSKDKHQSNEDYLTKLVTAMLNEDGDTLGVNNTNALTCTQEYIRALLSICLEYTNPKSLAWKQEFSEQIATLASPKDDPMFFELQEKCVGKLLYDNDTRASQKLFRIVAIQFVRSYSSARWRNNPLYLRASSYQLTSSILSWLI